MNNCCCSTTTKTPVYLENVIYFFEKLDTYYKNTFALKSECQNCPNANNSDSAVLQALDKLAVIIGNKGSCCTCIGSESTINADDLNNAIDNYFDNIDDTDTTLSDSLTSYFSDKMATLSGGE